jgi:hypothetical protein
MNTAQLPPAPPSGPPVGPRAGPPRKPRHWYVFGLRSSWNLLWTIPAMFAAGLLTLTTSLSAAGVGSPHTAVPKPAATVTVAAKPKPAATVTVAAKPKPAVTVTAKPTPAATVTVAPAAPAAPAAPPADQILAKFYGSGSGNTGAFTVPADGNWHLSWAYTNGSLFAGQSENFIVWEKGTDGTLDQGLVNALAIGTGQPTAVPVYSDSLAGSQAYFQVITDDANWELVVVSGIS